MQLWALASGSSGNCYLLESEGTRLLVEAGRPFREVVRNLARCGLDPGDLDGILLTHAHGDHSRSARELSEAYRVPVYASAGTLGCESLRDSALGRPVQAGRPTLVGEVEVRPFAVPHDCCEPLGFRFEAHTGSVCIATDLGWVPESVRASFLDLDLLVLEANYDPLLLENGRYPAFLKRRVAGPHGHLSNSDAGASVAACGDRAPRAVWLAHISEHNNTPRHAVETVSGILGRRGLSHATVQATRHRRPSLYWNSAHTFQQLTLL